MDFTKNRTSEYIEIFDQARRLSEQFSRRDIDIKFESSGGETFHAIDNDIITLITAPWRTKNERYLDCIVGDYSEAREALAYLLAEYLLTDKSSSPFIIIPPAEYELEGIWNLVYEKATKEHEELLSDVDGIIDGRPIDRTIKSDSREEVIRRIFNSLLGRQSAITELRRISKLIENGVVDKMASISWRTKLGYPFPKETPESEKVISRYESNWLKALSRVRRKRGNVGTRELARNNNVDAAVLARIQWINEDFVRNGSSSRLLFLTGDTHIEKVAKTVDFFDRSFATAIIRTPASFLADPDFFRKIKLRRPFYETQKPKVNLSSSSFRDWLQYTFPKIEEHPLKKELISPDVENAVDLAAQEWAIYLISSASEIRITDKELLKRVEECVDASRHTNLKEVRDEFKELKLQILTIGTWALSRFGAAGALAGFWSLDFRRQCRERNIPAVKFDSMPVAAKYAKTLRVSENIEAVQLEIGRQWLVDLDESDPTGYTALVVFSLAFALAGEWDTAYKLAKAAVLIADRLRSVTKHAKIKGDEACYLCAIFSRLLSKSYDQTLQSEDWLKEAYKRLRQKPTRNSIKNIKMYQEPRFEAERLGLRLCQRFFLTFPQEKQAGYKSQLLDAYSIQDELDSYGPVWSMVEQEQLDYVENYVREQLAVNYLQLNLIAFGSDKSVNVDDKKLVMCLEELREKSIIVSPRSKKSRKEEKGKSRLVYFVYLTASAVFAPAIAGWDDLGKINVLYNDLIENGKMLQLMPYDNSRMNFFIGMVNEVKNTTKNDTSH